MTVDTVIKGGQVFSGGRIRRSGLAVDDGRITSLCSESRLPRAERVVDAAGLLVLPGLVDAHVHFRDMGEAHKEDWWTGSCAAAAGGVTTVVDEPNNVPHTLSVDVVKRKKSLAAQQSIVDYGITAGLTPDNIPMVPSLRAEGVKSFEIFEGGDGDYPYITDTGDIYEALVAVKAAGGLMCLNARESTLKARLSKRIREAGGRTIRDLAGNSPGVEEAVGAAKNLLLARHVGVRAHLREVSSVDALRVVEALKPAGLTLEATPYHLLLSDRDAERLGPYGLVLPPLKPREHMEAMWDSLNRGVIDVVASDHAPHTRENKDPGLKDIWSAPPGVPAVQSMLPLLLTKVNEGKLTLERLVEAVSTKPATIWGLYPRKGDIRVGADADLVLVDVDVVGSVEAGELHSKCGWSPFEGMKYRGKPVETMVRGETVMKDNEITGEPGGGTFQPL